MPANVETMFSRVEVPWHGLGYISDRALTLDEAIPAAGLNWEMQKIPSVIHLNGEIIPNKGVFDLVRMDKKISFGQCTEQYQIAQNRELGEFVEALTGDSEAEFETAGVLDYGRRVWFLCRLRKELYVAGDAIMPFFLISASHDGKGGIVVCMTPIRVVCANTLAMALAGTKRVISARHIGNIEARLSEKARILGLSKVYIETFEEVCNKLVAKKISAAATEKLLTEVLFPIKEGAAKRGITLMENARDIVRNCIKKEDLQNVQGTAWAVFNGVADYSDHDRIIKGIENDLRAAQERGFVRTWDEKDQTLKDQTLAYLLAL